MCENTTASIENVLSSDKYCSQSIFLISSYTSSALFATKVCMGFKMRNAVRQCKLALYSKALSPVKETMRMPVSTFCAPNSINSSASTSSSSAIVLATI